MFPVCRVMDLAFKQRLVAVSGPVPAPDSNEIHIGGYVYRDVAVTAMDTIDTSDVILDVKESVDKLYSCSLFTRKIGEFHLSNNPQDLPGREEKQGIHKQLLSQMDDLFSTRNQRPNKQR